MNDKGEGGESGSKFQFLQPNRDLESNWEVDLAKKLEDYLLKICSGEITSEEDGNLSINFAEAALLIQGSIQVYSRKVEYLYSLVLHALEFISQKRQDKQENNSSQQNEGEAFAFGDEENEEFLGLDEVLVEAKNCLDEGSDEEDVANHFTKAPANMLVMEGDCLDSGGDAGELDSYLLASNNLFEDFVLLDPSDAGAVYNFIQGSHSAGQNTGVEGSSVRLRTHRSSMLSPVGRSGGSAHRSGNGKRPEDIVKQTPGINIGFETNNNNFCSESQEDFSRGNQHLERESDGDYAEVRDDSDDDEDDPWKPLNPHECGNLKVKPFKKGKIHKRRICSLWQKDITLQFPLARLDGPKCPEFAGMPKFRPGNLDKPLNSQSSPLYEKLRSSLVLGETRTGADFNGFKGGNENMCENDLPDFEHDDVGFQDHVYMDDEVPLPTEKQNDDNFDTNEAFDPEEPCSQASLEDLCRSHLDALLANIGETEKQTELAARVLMWKQGIEEAMEEQDSHPPFDIQEYGERVLEKLSLDNDSGGVMSFTDIVCGQADYDVARTFSALLQLVNNRTVDIRRGDSDAASVCYTAEHPFSVQILSPRKRVVEMRSAKKRMKSPVKRSNLHRNAVEKLPTVSLLLSTSPGKSSKQPKGSISVKLGKGSSIRCTPEGKRRRRSCVVEPG